MIKFNKLIESFLKENYEPTTVQDIINDFKEQQQEEDFNENEFIHDISSSDLEEAIPNIYSPYFDNPHQYSGIVYHHTSEENRESILQNGLQPSNKTRGFSNRSIGAATFTSAEIDEMSSYGEVIFEIDLKKARELNPDIETSLEPPIEEYYRKIQIANIFGIEDQGQFGPDSSDGLREDTLVVYGHIAKEAIKEIKYY